MKIFAQQLVLSALLCAGCKSAPETAPRAVSDPASEQPVKSAPLEPATVLEAEPAAPRSVVPRVYDENTSTISARVGERFEIALPGNITTPLKWSLDPTSMSDLVTLSAQSYSDTPPPDCAGCVGYPGTAHFVLDAAQEGTTTLRFAYRKLGQAAGQAKREIAIKLTVEL